MRFGEGMIGLSVIEADLLANMPLEAHRAFGSLMLLKTVCEESAGAIVKILKNFESQGINPDELQLRTAQLEMGDNYIQIHDIERIREQLEELFNDQLAPASSDDVLEDCALRAAEHALSQLS